MPNHLVGETSPYLLQHADNPVDWYPWGPAALERARREDKPILLSVGYSTCHWCHVMAHESFEDPAVAAEMNARFVCVKVDREERPDLDQIYQAAQQLLTGRPGGWPLTLFLAPDQTPFFGGTYFPRTARYYLPGFVDVLRGVELAWRERRGEVLEQNDALRAALAAGMVVDAPTAAQPAPDPEPVVARIKQGFDPVHGGFGRAPKFARPAELEFLERWGDEEARAQVRLTLARMVRGGIMDQLGGGFFRYATDDRWSIPHFEKMLYDNGPLLGLYADAWAATGDPAFARAAAGIVAWLEREMTDPEGGFHAALDADSEHEEGRFYIWHRDQVRELLNAREYAMAEACWGLDRAPNFENRAWHLTQARPVDDVAGRLGLSPALAADLLESAAAKLYAARAGRARPSRDEKRLTAWNALMIKGLAHAARRLGEPAWLEMARRAADSLRRRVWSEGRLAANWKDGAARQNGYLDDYAFLLEALLELLQAGYRAADLEWAVALADALLARFEDGERGGFWFTSHDHEPLIHRAKPVHDQATPSGNGVAALALGRLARLLGEERWGRAARRAVAAQGAILIDQPEAAPTLLRAALELDRPGPVVVLRGHGAELDQWHRLADNTAPADCLVISLPAGLGGLPAMLDKPLPVGGARVVAHVCSGVNCLAPIVRLDELRVILRKGAVN